MLEVHALAERPAGALRAVGSKMSCYFFSDILQPSHVLSVCFSSGEGQKDKQYTATIGGGTRTLLQGTRGVCLHWSRVVNTHVFFCCVGVDQGRCPLSLF